MCGKTPAKYFGGKYGRFHKKNVMGSVFSLKKLYGTLHVVEIYSVGALCYCLIYIVNAVGKLIRSKERGNNLNRRNNIIAFTNIKGSDLTEFLMRPTNCNYNSHKQTVQR